MLQRYSKALAVKLSPKAPPHQAHSVTRVMPWSPTALVNQMSPCGCSPSP